MAEGRVLIKKSTLTEIGNAIREKTGKTDLINPDNMSAEIGSIESGGGGGIKVLFDFKKSCAYEFYYQRTITSEQLNELISYDDTSNVTNMSYMFNMCYALINAPQLNTSNVTDMSHMFESCDKLETVPFYNTESVTNMSYMFKGCRALNELPAFDFSKTTNLSNFCNNCDVLEEALISDTPVATGMDAMFYECEKLKSIKGLNADKVTVNSGLSNIVYGCKALTEFMIYNVRVNLQIGSGTSWGHLLTLESLINTCKECINYNNSTTRKLTMGSANLEKIANVYVKFTDPSQTTIATGEKGDVVVCESTDTGAMTITQYMTLKKWQLA